MKKHRFGWWLLAVVVLIAAIGGGIWIGKRTQTTTHPVVTSKAADKTKQTSHSSQSSSASKEATATKSSSSRAVSQDSTNNLKADSSLEAGGLEATTIAYYASNHVGQKGRHSWKEIYQSWVSDLGTVIVSKLNVAQLSKPGMGVVYFAVPRGGDVDSEQLSTYPSYTLEKDKRINIYQPDGAKKPAMTVSLTEVVQYANQMHQAAKIREIGQAMAIGDRRDDVEPDGDANHLSNKDLETDQMVEKIVICYGMLRDTDEFWQNLQADFDNGALVIAKSDKGGNFIGVPQNSTGCIVYYAPQNTTGGVPDLYNFGHVDGDSQTNGDIPGSNSVGFTTGEMIKYINAHGGRAALDGINLAPGSHFESF